MVAVKDYQRFVKEYGNILKVSLHSLKKKEKKRTDKAGEKQGGASKAS